MDTSLDFKLKPLSTADIQTRILEAEAQIEAGSFINADEAHRIMRSHILGLD